MQAGERVVPAIVSGVVLSTLRRGLYVPRKEQTFGVAHEEHSQQACTDSKLRREKVDGKPRTRDA